jgi:hypothetical protein
LVIVPSLYLQLETYEEAAIEALLDHHTFHICILETFEEAAIEALCGNRSFRIYNKTVQKFLPTAQVFY